MHPGNKVYIEYLEVNEIEAICWLCDFSSLAYLDNYDTSLKLSHIGTRDLLYIKSIDPDTGRIELTRCLSSL